MRRIRIALMVGISLLAAGACGRGGENSPEQAAQPPRAEAAHPAAPREAAPAAEAAGGGRAALIAEGRQMFEQRCVTCHGEEGNGKGPAGAGLQPPPRDFTDPAWQAATSSERIKQVISYGGAAVGLSPVMPSQPDLANDPSELDALVAYVRTFSGKRDEHAVAGP
jgi:mono/diheme cytochrome c family protein